MSSSDAPKSDHDVPQVSFAPADDGPKVTTQPSQSDEERDLQEENAETSLDQPSS